MGYQPLETPTLGTPPTLPVVKPMTPEVVKPSTTPGVTADNPASTAPPDLPSTGLLTESTTPPPPVAPSAPNATYTDPTKVSPLVSEQVTGLLSQNNPYMQQAATKGAQYANQRGLLNTSLGAEAAQNAAISAALPIAQQDAAFAAGLETNRLQSQLTFDSNKALQDDQLAIQIMGSDMSEDSKNAALDWLLGTGSTLNVSPKTPAEKYGDYKKVQTDYGDFQKMVLDSDAIGYWRTEPDATWDEILTDMGRSKVPTGASSSLGGGIKSTAWSRQDEATAKAIKQLYGSWDNALRAARTWAGPNVDEKTLTQMIMASLK